MAALIAGAPAMFRGVLRLVDGEWVFDTESFAADGYLIDVGGEPTIDDAETTGQRIYVNSTGDLVSY